MKITVQEGNLKKIEKPKTCLWATRIQSKMRYTTLRVKFTQKWNISAKHCTILRTGQGGNQKRVSRLSFLPLFLSEQEKNPNICLENGFCVSALAPSANKRQLRKKLDLDTSVNWLLTVSVSLMWQHHCILTAFGAAGNLSFKLQASRWGLGALPACVMLESLMASGFPGACSPLGVRGSQRDNSETS